jgi:hypothetical protein
MEKQIPFPTLFMATQCTAQGLIKIGITRGMCTPVKGSEYLNDSLLTPTLAMAWQLHHK